VVIGACFLTLWASNDPRAVAVASLRAKTNTALSLTLLGIGAIGAALKWRSTAAQAACFGVPALLGLGTLIEYFSGVDLGIDQLLASDLEVLHPGAFPNRMSPISAVHFMLLGVAAVCVTRSERRWVRAGQVLALTTLASSTFALIGYLYSISYLYQPTRFLPISPYTAVAHSFLAFALLAVRSDVGVVRAAASPTIGGYVVRRLLPLTVAGPVLLGYFSVEHSDSHLSHGEAHALHATLVAVVTSSMVLFLARSLDALERKRNAAERFLRLSGELTAALAQARTVEEATAVTLDVGLEALGATAGVLLLLSDDKSELVPVASRGYPNREHDSCGRLSLSQASPAADAVKGRESVFIRADEIHRLPEAARAIPGEPRAWAALPLEGNSGVLGVIALSFGSGERFATATRERVRRLAWQCAQAIERAKLFDSEQTAREQAESASRAKDEFLAMLGHELRNPLSPILTSLHLMELKAPGDSCREREVIRRQVNHMVRLVDDLLDVSRIANGRVELRRRRIEVDSVIATALEVVSPLIEQRRHLVERTGSGGVSMVYVDPDRIAQVVGNLLANAAKYSDPGTRIRVHTEQHTESVVVRVIDHGMGIAPELLPDVFDLFVQGRRTLERSEGGLGLGLSIVKSLVELHGGAVEARSPGPGEGSEFSFRLPLALEADEAPRDPALGVAPHSVGRPRRVLVVDDNRDAADTLAQALKAFGHDVRVAYDGPSALAVFAEFRPGLAFLDIGLPVMDGYELARRLREDASAHPLTLVALTGYGQEADRERSTSAGFDRHLVKPVPVDEVLALACRGSSVEIN
jgi:signal transduction histidine kinase/CheY-like chemotaxis protein